MPNNKSTLFTAHRYASAAFLLRATTSKARSRSSPLHVRSGFANPVRLRLMMAEKGILDDYTEVLLDMEVSGEQRGWRHGKRNAFGEAPTLELEDGSFLSETAAIAQYLDDVHPGRKILGETVLERALDRQWDDRINGHLLSRFVTTFHVQVRPSR